MCYPCAPGSPRLSARDGCKGCFHRAGVNAAGESETLPEDPLYVQTHQVTDADGSKEARLRTEARSIQHLLTHLPKNPYCPSCQVGKMVKQHSRKRVPEEDEVIGFGVKCTADTLYSRGEKSRAMDASEYAIVFLDLGTKWRDAHCSCERSE